MFDQNSSSWYLGVYWIDPDWGSHGNALQASCNFTLQMTCIQPTNPKKIDIHEEVSCINKNSFCST